LETLTYKPGFYSMYGVRAEDGQQYQHYEALNPLRVTRLRVNGDPVMVDDPPHWFGTLEAASKYTGHVLCAGLGLGLIVHALRRNPRVTAITVVERSPDVIDLIWPHLAPNGRPEGGPQLTLWRGDWWDVNPGALSELVEPPTGIHFDLLVGNGKDLVGAATRAVIDMRRRWPGVPHTVFGMNADVINEMLDEADEQAARHRAAMCAERNPSNRLTCDAGGEQYGVSHQPQDAEVIRESDPPTETANRARNATGQSRAAVATRRARRSAAAGGSRADR
jgi:hypothetical protein